MPAVPKRSDQVRRRNKTERGVPIPPVEFAAGAVLVSQPAADESWHEIARDWYCSLAQSGQAVFYQPSDWQSARVWAELLSRQLASGRPSSQMIAAWAAGATELLTTEGARRRSRLELQKQVVDADEEAAVSDLDDYRSRVS